MHAVAIIPARGGSKGIPKKNLADFCGQPLLAWTIACCRRCRLINGVFVSTDASEIAAVAKRYGAEAIARPPELSTDIADSESALIHALDFIESNRSGTGGCRGFFAGHLPAAGAGGTRRGAREIQG